MKVWDQINAANETVKVIQLPAGRLNAVNATEMRTQLLDILAGQIGSLTSVIVDLSLITFVDSIGMSVLIALLRYCNESSLDLKLVGVQPQAKPTFDILEMTQVFQFFDTIGDAIATVDPINHP